MINPIKRKPVTLEEYTVYKALKEDRIPIVGYETPERQFNLVTKVSYVGEAIDVVLGAGDVDTLAQALKNFKLEPEVKTALEERVLCGIIELGKTAKPCWVWVAPNKGFSAKYSSTPELLAAARKYSADFPTIIEEVAKFLLYDKHSPLPEYETGENLSRWNVRTGIELLLGVGKSAAEVAVEVGKAIPGKHGSFHTIIRYLEGLDEILPNQSGENKTYSEVYAALSSTWVGVLTPELLEDALRQIKLSDEEFKQENPATKGTHYANIKMMAEKVRNGSYEKFSDFEDGHPEEETESYLKSVSNRIQSIEDDLGKGYGSVDRSIQFFKEEHISPLVTVLHDLESDLGHDEFIARGYQRVQEKIDGVVVEVEGGQEYIKIELPLVKERLVKERETRSQPKPWYRKMFE